MLEFAYPAKTWLPYLRLLVEAIQWVAWPVALVIVARSFKEPISAILAKLRSIGFAGGKAEFAQTQVSPQSDLDNLLPGPEVPRGSAQTVLIERFLTEAQKKIRDRVRNELEDFPEEQRSEVLIAAVAQERLQKHFALAYANIFGSQIRALELLNQRMGRIDRAEAGRMFEDLRREHNEFKEWTLDKYTLFLRNYLFIEESNEEISLTPFGKEFILWLDTLGLSKDRPL